MRVAMSRFLVGVFVGGRAVRLGGIPKGLLAAPDTDEPIVSRLARVCREALPECEVVLVGDASSYAHLAHHSIPDRPPGVGPIGGLIALLSSAVACGASAIAVATDLPYVSRELVTRLSLHAPSAAAVAPRVDDLWQPLFARYDGERSLSAAKAVLAGGHRALHRVLSALGSEVAELPVTPEETLLLRDWDTPNDVGGGGGPFA